MSKFIGFDPGTSNLVLAYEGKDGISYITERNAFNLITPVTPIHKKMLIQGLEKNKSKWIEIDDDICVVGQYAIDLANSGSGKVLRPMSTGKINPAEKKSRRILRYLITKMVEPFIEKGTKVVFSCTGSAVDLPKDKIFDTGAHQDFLRAIFEDLGASVMVIDEAEAVAYSELLDSGLTGYAMSCLHPETKVETFKGLIPIKNVQVGDLVRTTGHKYNKVVNIVPTQKEEEVLYTINVHCGGKYSVTGDHRILTTDGWIEAKNLTTKHRLKEPINDYKGTRLTYSFARDIKFQASRDFSWFLGLWLGDGYASKEGKIEICLGKQETHLIERLKEVVLRYFGKELTIKPDRGMVRCRFYNKQVGDKLRVDYYDEDGNKVFPFDISELNIEAIVGLLQGMIDSDGYISIDNTGSKKIAFTNTSPNLWTIFRNGLSLLGLTGKFIDFSGCSEKETLCKEGHYIPSAKKEYYEIMVGGIEAEILLHYFENRASRKVVNSGGYKVFGITSITQEEPYTGLVYDLTIEENHNFTAPGICFHNCGAGTFSSGIFLGGQPITTFCTSRAGDYIDNYTAEADIDWTPSLVQTEKESMDLNKPQNEMQETIVGYYRRLFKYSIQNIARGLTQQKVQQFTEPIDMVVAGGTISVKNAVGILKEVLESVDFPIPIKGIRLAHNSLFTTADGCLVAASL